MAVSNRRLIVTFSGYQPNVDYTIPANREEIRKEADSWVSAVENTCLNTFKKSKRQTFDIMSDALLDEAQEWYQKSFTNAEKFKHKHLKDFVTKFRDNYCSAPTNYPKDNAISKTTTSDRTLDLLQTLTSLVQVLETRVKKCEVAMSQQQFKGDRGLNKDMTLLKERQNQQERDQQFSINLLVNRIEDLETELLKGGKVPSLEATVKALQIKIQEQDNTIADLRQALKTHCEKCDMLSSSKKLSQTDTVKSLRDKQKYLEQEMMAQKEDTTKKISSISASVVSFEQLDEQRATLAKLADDVQALTSNIGSAAVCNVTRQAEISTATASNPCYRCGRRFHHERNCGAQYLVCFNCGKRGHFARCCEAQKKQNDLICNRCGNNDHTGDKCGALRKAMSCWNCSRPGHLYRRCKFKDKLPVYF